MTASQSLSDSALDEIKSHYENLALKLQRQNAFEKSHLSLIPQLLPRVNEWLDDPANVESMLREPSPRSELPWGRKIKKKKALKIINSKKFDALLEEKPKPLSFPDGEYVPRFATNPRWILSTPYQITNFHSILLILSIFAVILGMLIILHCLPPLVLPGLVI